MEELTIGIMTVVAEGETKVIRKVPTMGEELELDVARRSKPEVGHIEEVVDKVRAQRDHGEARRDTVLYAENREKRVVPFRPGQGKGYVLGTRQRTERGVCQDVRGRQFGKERL